MPTEHPARPPRRAPAPDAPHTSSTAPERPGWAEIVLGLLAFWLALPPWTVRTIGFVAWLCRHLTAPDAFSIRKHRDRLMRSCGQRYAYALARSIARWYCRYVGIRRARRVGRRVLRPLSPGRRENRLASSA